MELYNEILNKVKGAIYVIPINYKSPYGEGFTVGGSCSVEIIQQHDQITGIPKQEYYYRNLYVGEYSVFFGQIHNFDSPDAALEHLLAQKGVTLAI